MLKTAAVVSEEEQLILSTVSPGAAQKRLALAVVLGLLTVFVLITAGPLGSIQTEPVAAFVPAYATAMFVCDSITAILLFAQFSILRSRAILIIASGYLFTALILIPWILAFPGVFAPNVGLIGGLQTTSWLYFVRARRPSCVRDRLRPVEGYGCRQTGLAGRDRFGDRSECRSDGGAGLGSRRSFASRAKRCCPVSSSIHSISARCGPMLGHPSRC